MRLRKTSDEPVTLYDTVEMIIIFIVVIGAALLLPWIMRLLGVI